ncbi:hypothetical protein SH661x_000771 [Planctomicrobium sp. SH661]|uniref:hypothetical protein n=1 Tax=Planctomicrobium sp. SH661 TaxID=3448124 RepID=UPI003F5BB25C
MSIRYECTGCGSVLKIKESLAGTSGKCPHCKNKFVVPEKGADSGVGIEAAEDSKIQKAPSAAAPKPAPVVAEKPKGNNGDDFDLDAFLMDDSAPGAKASAGLSSPPVAPPAAPQPKFDKQGRRTFAAPPPSPGSSAEMPTRDAANAAINASANARDLLSKSAEEGKAKAGSLPTGPRKPLINFDVAGTLKEFRQYALYILGGIVLVFGLYWLSDRMLSSRLELPKLAAVSGTVTLDGNPLPNVTVYLAPVNPEGKSTRGKPLRLRDASGVTDENGFYTVLYMNGVSGAPVGKTRIWLQPLNPADFKKIPGKYLSNGSTDIREVKEVGNEAKFNLDLKTP